MYTRLRTREILIKPNVFDSLSSSASSARFCMVLYLRYSPRGQLRNIAINLFAQSLIISPSMIFLLKFDLAEQRTFH